MCVSVREEINGDRFDVHSRRVHSRRVHMLSCSAPPLTLNAFARLRARPSPGTSPYKVAFLLVYFVGGLFGVAENAVLVVCALRFKRNVATVVALVGSTAAGLGCMAGPPLGGLLYAAGSTAAWKVCLLHISVYIQSIFSLCSVYVQSMFSLCSV